MGFSRLLRAFAFSIPLLVLAACGSGDKAPSTPPAAVADIQIDRAWLRGTPPGAQVGAGYATLVNNSDRERSVVGVETEVSGSAELHSMAMENGMMQMRHLERLRIPAHGSVVLQPGGNHLMLFGLKAPLVAGQSVPIRFVFADGERVSATFAVRDAAP